jgi:hypothetical protein
MEKKNKKEAPIPQSPGDALIGNRFKKMVDLLAENFKRDEPLTAKPTEFKSGKPLPVDWQLPQEAYSSHYHDEHYYPGHMEIDTEAVGNTYISIIDKEQHIENKAYNLGRTVVMVKPTASKKPEFFYMTDDARDNFYITITAGRIGNDPPRAFLMASCEDGAGYRDKDSYYLEPEEFCILSITDEDCDREEGIFTLFIKKSGILVTRFFSGSPGLKTVRLSGKTFPYPPLPSPRAMTDQDEKFVRTRFGELADQYAITVKPGTTRESKPIPQSHPEGSPFDTLRPDRQDLSQEQMHSFCGLIRRRLGRSTGEDYKGLSFKNWNGNGCDTNCEVRLKPVGDDRVYLFSLHGDNELDAAIIAGDSGNGSYMAFLVVKGKDNQEYVFELEWFASLPVHCKRESGHLGIFTMFNRIPNVFIYEYEPLTATGDGCAFIKR